MFSLNDDSAESNSDDECSAGTSKNLAQNSERLISKFGASNGLSSVAFSWCPKPKFHDVAKVEHEKVTSDKTTPLFVLDVEPASKSDFLLAPESPQKTANLKESAKSKKKKFFQKKLAQKVDDVKQIKLAGKLDDKAENQRNLYIDLRAKFPKSCEDMESRRKTLRSKMDAKKIDEIMKKSVITEGFIKQEKMLPYYESDRSQRKRRKAVREKTKGKDWFDLPATEMTDERRRDLEILMMRNALDTKNYYRQEDRKILPKYFQVGTVIEHATDFYTDRMPKKQRKQTIVDELLADDAFRKKNKDRYKEIVQKKSHLRVKNKPWPKKPTKTVF